MAAAAEVQTHDVPTTKKQGVEGLIKAKLSLVQERIKGVEGDVRTRVAGLRTQLETAQKGAVAKLRGALKLDRLQALLAQVRLDKVGEAAEKVVADGVKLTEETAQKLGLAKVADLQGLAKLADLSSLKDALEGMQKKVEQLRAKVEGLAGAPKAAPSDVTPKNAE